MTPSGYVVVAAEPGHVCGARHQPAVSAAYAVTADGVTKHLCEHHALSVGAIPSLAEQAKVRR